MIWLGERMTGLRIDQICPIDDVEHIAPRAVLFIHGTQDPTVNVSNSVKLYNAACEPKSLYLVKNAGHSGLLFASPPEFDLRVADFLDRHLREIKPGAPIPSAA